MSRTKRSAGKSKKHTLRTKVAKKSEIKWVNRFKQDEYKSSHSSAFAPVQSKKTGLAGAGDWIGDHKLIVAGSAVALAFIFVPKAAAASAPTNPTPAQQAEISAQQSAATGRKIGMAAFGLIAAATIVWAVTSNKK